MPSITKASNLKSVTNKRKTFQRNAPSPYKPLAFISTWLKTCKLYDELFLNLKHGYMKSFILFFIAFILALTQEGCMSGNKMRCPELASKKTKPILLAKVNRIERRKHHSENQQSEVAAGRSIPDNVTTNEKIFKVKIPAFAAKRLEEQDINDVNDFFKSQSENGISMVKNVNNKVYLEAKSPAEFIRVATSLAFKHAAPAAPDGGGGGMAIASGVLGIVGFLCALGPYIGFFAFLCALLAIILGAISINSRRRGWAITGIVLGVITLAMAALFIRYVYIRFI
jgi:hypothetical protein